jgi:hypothetical protein
VKITARAHAAGEALLYDITGVEIFDVGTWNERDYSDADLNEMVANFATLSASGYDFPIKLSHDKDQQLISNSELPAAGYIERLYRSGTKLVADFTRIPEKVKEVVDLGAFRTVSTEIFDRVQLLGRTWKNVVSAVAFLGAEIPGATRTLVTYSQKEAPVTKDNKTVDNAEGLHDELVALADRANAATSGKKGAPSFRTLLRESISKLRAMLKTPAKNAVDSYQERWTELQEAVREKYGGPDGYAAWLEDFGLDDAGDFLVMNWGGSYWKLPYSDNEDAEVITLGDPIEVEQGPWVPKNAPATNKVRITTPARPGGKEEDMATSAAILKALGLPDGADEPTVLKAIADKDAEKAKFTANDTRLAELEAKDKKRDADDAVEGAIRARKLLPAQREWAATYAAKDPAGFKTYVEKSPELFKEGELGSSADAPESKSPVSEFQAKVAEKLKANKDMDIGDAQKAVALEEPALFNAVRALR